MDIITPLVSFLSPYLPTLLGLGKKALDKGAEKLGEKGAEEIFKKLSPHLEAKPSAKEAVVYVAENPDDADGLGQLRLQLKKILEAPENAVLKAEIAKILEGEESTAKGKFNINAQGANIGVIGDRAKIDNMNFGNKP
ncbi:MULTISPECIES: hypothetical protein [Pseudanabaena]|jgi:hypothetical protein|uniref:hypothetical protein n=1 Tax=Pseudanabaena TaxID=1152 RepID=UPI002479A6BF|nr:MULTISPECIES: hypothetical protein [Pseudanabaena]MEA5486848.1 hypothetical protein [Pseudanabaena sp. CCNP1317]WGS73270.1 hypothetical protein OA858_04365 [Pseudanabaena galeata CCNP1313]